MDSSQDRAVLWSGKPNPSLPDPNNAMFLFSIRGFMEWGPGGNGTAADQDVALFRNQLPGLSVQNFTATPKTSAKAFSVNAPYTVSSPYSGSSGEYPVFALDTENIAVRVGAGQSGFADSDSFTTVGRKTTTDTTAQTLATITLDTPRAYDITVKVVARKSDGMEFAFFYKAALAYRQGGNATLVTAAGANPNPGDLGGTPIWSSGATGWTCTMSPSGNDILVRVKTDTAITVYWVATIEYQSVSTDS